MDHAAWAWEFLKLNPDFQREVAHWSPSPSLVRKRPIIRVVDACDTQVMESWGLAYLEWPNVHDRDGVIMWRPDLNCRVLVARACSDPTASDVVDFRALNCSVDVINTTTGASHVLLRQEQNIIQLRVDGASLLEGPIHLTFLMDGLFDVKQRVHTLNRFLAFLRSGVIPPAPTPALRTATRLQLALQIYPLVRAGHSDKRIAIKLFPDHDVEQWTAANDWIRSQVRRARTQAVSLVDGGYRSLLSSDGADDIPSA